MGGEDCRMRVAVVGAGAAGLAALRHLARDSKRFAPTAFEMTPHVSGTWVYTDRTGLDDRGLPIHSSMYKNLRTNLPKEVMAFPGFPINKSLPSFITHQEVRQYLEDFAEHYKLRQYIQFNKKVDWIQPVVTSGGNRTWKVDVSDVTNQSQPPENLTFDAVIVCNGHYAVPLVPKLPGLDSFRGQIMHSHDYRTPDVFPGKAVAVLGAASSGQDIAVEIASVCSQVYLCHKRDRLKTVLPSNVTQCSGIKEVRVSSVILDDDQEVQVDAILFCTGYHFDFKFLSSECLLRIEDERIQPLYKHLIHTRFPTLSFIGIVKTVCPFPLFDCQIRFVLAALTGDMVLPSTEDMDKDTAEDFQWRRSQGMPVRHAHTMGTLQWAYNDQLAQLAAFEPIPKVVQSLYNYVHEIRVKNVPGYKRTNYELVSDTEFREI